MTRTSGSDANTGVLRVTVAVDRKVPTRVEPNPEDPPTSEVICQCWQSSHNDLHICEFKFIDSQDPTAYVYVQVDFLRGLLHRTSIASESVVPDGCVPVPAELDRIHLAFTQLNAISALLRVCVHVRYFTTMGAAELPFELLALK